MKHFRRELYYYEPTKAWLASENPRTKKDILAWYKREKRTLEKRRYGPVIRKFPAHTVIVDAETKKPLKRSKKPTEHKLELWKLSPGDVQTYLDSLERRFEELKNEYNKRLRAKKKKIQSSGRSET